MCKEISLLSIFFFFQTSLSRVWHQYDVLAIFSYFLSLAPKKKASACLKPFCKTNERHFHYYFLFLGDSCPGLSCLVMITVLRSYNIFVDVAHFHSVPKALLSLACKLVNSLLNCGVFVSDSPKMSGISAIVICCCCSILRQTRQHPACLEQDFPSAHLAQKQMSKG